MPKRGLADQQQLSSPERYTIRGWLRRDQREHRRGRREREAADRGLRKSLCSVQRPVDWATRARRLARDAGPRPSSFIKCSLAPASAEAKPKLSAVESGEGRGAVRDRKGRHERPQSCVICVRAHRQFCAMNFKIKCRGGLSSAAPGTACRESETR